MKFFSCSHADVWETLNKRVSELETRYSKLEIEQEWLRNKVLRRIQAKNSTLEEAEDKEKDLYNGVLIRTNV